MKRLILLVVAVAIPSLSLQAKALTARGFVDICQSKPRECHTLPVIQAYVGGALDLVATLDEQTDYLDKIYCESPKTLFDIPKIVDYMLEHANEYAAKNAMILLVRYFEQHGGCK